MAMLKFGHAALVNSSIDSDQWTDIVYKEACKDGKCRLKVAKSVIAKYSPDRYLLSHCTIIASVDVELADPNNPKTDYYIRPEFSKFVNNNGDAWTKGVILNSYKTFIGGENYCEHVQIPELSKGKIIDAVPREIVIGRDKDGKELSTIYIDILVATDRKHEDLIRKIESKEYNAMSMGCVIKYSICSRCGNKASDDTQACEHVRFQKNNMFFDENGVQRKIAELCGHESDPDSVRFIEASWVRQPAFTGAVLRSFVEPSKELISKIEFSKNIPSYKRKEGDFLKVASGFSLVAQDEPTGDEGAGTGNIYEEGVEDIEENDIKEMKRDLKKKILKQIQEEVLEEFSKEEEEAPRDIETLDETLIKPASVILSKLWKAQKSWDEFIDQKLKVKPDKKSYDKLRYGIHIAMTNNDLTSLKNFGYSKRDVLAVLSFIDDCFKDRLSVDIKRAVASVDRTDLDPVVLLATVVSKIGRQLTRKEAKKVLSWFRLLSYYS